MTGGGAGQGDTGETKVPKRQTLLQRFEIPIEQVDYKYVEKCSDTKKLERILLVLRSGEEGFYPDLERFVTAKLREHNPCNRLLRIEVPILHRESLPTQDRSQLDSDLVDFINRVKLDESSVILGEDKTETETSKSPPIRNSTVITKMDTPQTVQSRTVEPFVKKSNPNRIKSGEYDKWSKYDADAEVMKLDIEQIKGDEDGNNKKVISKQKLIETSKKFVEKIAKPEAPEKTNRSLVQQNNGHSFIEELPDDSVTMSQEGEKKKRRVKIIIDDINIGGF